MPVTREAALAQLGFAAAGVTAAGWDEAKHPRGFHGQFGHGVKALVDTQPRTWLPQSDDDYAMLGWWGGDYKKAAKVLRSSKDRRYEPVDRRRPDEIADDWKRDPRSRGPRYAGWNMDSQDENIAKVDDVMKRSVTRHPITVYRGMAGTSRQMDSLKPGDVFTDKAFVSTTPDRDDALDYAEIRQNSAPGKKRTAAKYQPIIAEIHVPAGTHAYGQDETGEGDAAISAELTLDRDLTYRVDSVEQRENHKVIRMSVIPNGN